MTEQIRVVLADDHAVVRKGIREFLEDEDDITVVAEAENGAQAVALANEHQPDVLVLDIQMPEMTGIEAARKIIAANPHARILVLTAYDDDPYIFAMLQTGANGYVLKNAPSDELVRAVRAVAHGDSALDPAVTAKVMSQITSGKPAGAQKMVENLTPCELDTPAAGSQRADQSCHWTIIGHQQPHGTGTFGEHFWQTECHHPYRSRVNCR